MLWALAQAMQVRWRGLQAWLMAQPPRRRVAWAIVLVAGALAALLVLYVLVLIPLTPSIRDLRQARAQRATVIESADGQQLANFDQGLQQRVTIKQVSPFVVQALIATEDQRFYSHHGIDFRRTASAMLHTLGGNSQGGSTITQQLARNMFPEEIGRSRNLNRKLKEAITAFKIESTYSKDEILEAYLNTVPFLYNTFGIEMAARTYFDKPAARLDVLESATLVGMLKGTNYYNPVNNPDRSLSRRNVVLGQMRKHDLLTEARYQALLKRPLRVRFNRQQDKNASSDTHFTAYVRKWLIDWADENDYNLQRDGLVVHTTLDSGLQKAALKAVQRQADALQSIADVEWSQRGEIGSMSTGTYTAMRGGVVPFRYFWDSHSDLALAVLRDSPEYHKAVDGGEPAAAVLKRLQADGKLVARLRAARTRLEAGLVALDPGSGAVRAWVGSRDFTREPFDHVVQAARQPGSTFKPVVYGAALEHGLLPDHPYRDAVTDIRAADGSVWRPTDMSGSSGKMLTMRDGLVYSKNTITAQVMQDVGLARVIKLARAMGIRTSKLDPVPSLALGTSPVTLLEMASVYSTIAAAGTYRAPYFVSSITDRSGNVVARFGPDKGQQALSAASAATLLDMLRGVINRGTGTAIRYRFGITADVAGKTGTTQNNTDGWFMLMHQNLVAGAWVGFDDARVTMRSSYWGQGGHNAVLLVGDFFRTALDNREIDAQAYFPGGKPAPLRPAAPVQPEPTDTVDAPDMPEDEGPAPQPDAPPAPAGNDTPADGAAPPAAPDALPAPAAAPAPAVPGG